MTALLCYNDQCAQGALVALARRGLSVPDDISVTGFDNTRGAASRAFDLTSVDREPAAVATLAVDMAISRCEGRDGPPRSESVRTRMVARSSSGPAPGAP